MTSSVCGIRATLKVPGGLSTPATVRLTPSTAIEPLIATKRFKVGGSSIITSRPEAAVSTVLDRGGRVDVALHEMPVEKRRCAERQLQVHL